MNCDGSEAVEFALISIPLFLFMVGVIEFGRLYWVQSELQYAAEAAARYVTINPNAGVGAVQSYAAAQVSGVSIPTGDFTVTHYSSASNTPSCGNQVTVSYQFQFTLSARARHSGASRRSATRKADECSSRHASSSPRAK